jgi:nucleotide-binding universal stress UspA family protein
MKKINIKKILVPVDFTETSDNALTSAITLAKSLKAGIILLHILDMNRDQFSIVAQTPSVPSNILELTRMIKGKMNEMKEQISKEHGIKTEATVQNGHVHSEITSFSKKNKPDLIVMGTHGVSGYKEMFIGSTAQRVVTLSDIPVITIQKSPGKAGFRNILIPIDNSLHSRQKVNLAIILAQAFKAKIHLVALAISKEKQELKSLTVKLESVEKIIKTDKLPYVSTIVHGSNMAKSAMNYATKNKCDLIVINTGHESKLTGIFLGAFAQQIVNHSKIPVLSIKHLSDHYEIEIPGFGI